MKVKQTYKLIASTALFMLWVQGVFAQCAMCTKTAQQLGEKPAAALNSAIIYLMMAPFAVIGVIAYRWWKNRQPD